MAAKYFEGFYLDIATVLPEAIEQEIKDEYSKFVAKVLKDFCTLNNIDLYAEDDRDLSEVFDFIYRAGQADGAGEDNRVDSWRFE
jgi:hypothetical protein